jgi:putative membrane protein
MPRMSLLIRLAINAVALWITTLIISGVHVTTDSTGKKVLTLIVVAIIFGIVNAILRPVIKTIGCAFYVLTLGLISIVVNGLLFLFASWIADQIGIPFKVDNFWPSAVLGALIVGIVSWLLSLVIPDKAQGKTA